MPIWGLLQFAMGLVVIISCLALIINKLNLIERAEVEAWKSQLQKARQKIRS
jgi:hypothetical protein